jgi:hypothetical protein
MSPWLIRPTNSRCEARSLSDLGNRSEGKSFRVKFFDRMRRIVFLFNELDREIWPKWLFRSRFILSPTGS